MFTKNEFISNVNFRDEISVLYLKLILAVFLWTPSHSNFSENEDCYF